MPNHTWVEGLWSGYRVSAPQTASDYLTIDGVWVTPGGSNSGSQGPAGPEGPQGPPGEDGAPGADGAQGPQGDPGADGADGAQGIQGIQGEPGADGATGAAGADGADGVGVPAGGSTGQVLAKASNTDHDTEWVDAATGSGSDSEKIVVLDSNVTTQSVTYVDITGLSFEALANKTYLIELFLYVSTNATANGVGLCITGPADPTRVTGWSRVPVADNAEQLSSWRAYDGAAPFGSLGSANNNDNLALVQALVINGANAGTIQARVRSELNTNIITVKAGSAMRYRQLD